MIKICFNENNFNNFIRILEPKIIEKFNLILQNKIDEEEEFLIYIRDVITIKQLLSVVPDKFVLKDVKSMSNVDQLINDKKFQLRNQINKTITPKDLGLFLKLLKGEELKKIIQKNNIKIKKIKKNEEFIKAIKNHTFNKDEKINFQKQYFILRTQELCKSIFEDFYLNDWDKILGYDKYKFVNSLELRTCPYCNRNYIFIVDEDKIRPEIDHFYPKSKYPYFAMSYFNLIPSCPNCNHKKSSNFDAKMVNPYSDFTKNNSINFSIDVNSIDFLDIKKEKYNFDSFHISMKSGTNKNIEIFKLEELYKQHKDVIVDLLMKYKYYPTSYIMYLKNYGFSDEEIYRTLYNNFKKDKDLHKRPLSKLIRDIALELKLIKD